MLKSSGAFRAYVVSDPPNNRSSYTPAPSHVLWSSSIVRKVGRLCRYDNHIISIILPQRGARPPSSRSEHDPFRQVKGHHYSGRRNQLYINRGHRNFEKAHRTPPLARCCCSEQRSIVLVLPGRVRSCCFCFQVCSCMGDAATLSPKMRSEALQRG